MWSPLCDVFNETEELKPCPFCGGEAEINYGMTYGFSYLYEPRCSSCGCMLDTYSTEGEAIEAWNRRVDPIKQGRWINGDCSECEFPIPTDGRIDYIAEADVHYCYNCGAKMDGDK